MNPLTQAREALQANHDWHMRDDPIAYIGSEMERVNMAALAALSAQDVPAPSIDEAKLLHLLESAFEDGFTSHATYNDTTLNSPSEEWAKEREHYTDQLRKLAAAPAAPKQAEAQQAAQPVEMHVCPRHDFELVTDPKAGCTLCNAEKAAQPVAGEPVASIYITPGGEREMDDWRHPLPVGRNILYTAAPAPVALVPMTDEQVSDLYARWYGTPGTSYADLIRAVEAHHGIKAGKDGAK